MDFYYANAHEFKYDTLERYVLRPFRQLTTSDPKCKVSNENASRPGDERKIATEVDYNMDIFYAGFGNTLFDMNAYHRAGIDLHRMFLIDKQSQIHCLDGSNSNEDKPAMNQPKTYARVRGTLFVDGYKDTKLIQHVHR